MTRGCHSEQSEESIGLPLDGFVREVLYRSCDKAPRWIFMPALLGITWTNTGFLAITAQCGLGRGAYRNAETLTMRPKFLSRQGGLQFCGPQYCGMKSKLYDIRIFLISVADIDRNENYYCCIRISF